MNKFDFTGMLLECDICHVKVVRTPDWRGGYEPIVYFNDDAENYNKVFESVYDRGVRIYISQEAIL